VLGRGEEVTGTDRRRRRHVAEVVERRDVTYVYADAELHAGIVPVAAARVEVADRDVSDSVGPLEVLRCGDAILRGRLLLGRLRAGT
jgi:hypothetical protein